MYFSADPLCEIVDSKHKIEKKRLSESLKVCVLNTFQPALFVITSLKKPICNAFWQATRYRGWE